MQTSRHKDAHVHTCAHNPTLRCVDEHRDPGTKTFTATDKAGWQAQSRTNKTPATGNTCGSRHPQRQTSHCIACPPPTLTLHREVGTTWSLEQRKPWTHLPSSWPRQQAAGSPKPGGPPGGESSRPSCFCYRHLVRPGPKGPLN